MASLENIFKITGFTVPQFEKDTVTFDYDNETEFEEFIKLSKTHGVFIYHQRYEHKVDEFLKSQPVFLPIFSYHYHCNHSGKKKPKDEEEDQLVTKKRRTTRKTSIKNGCSAKFQKTILANGKIQVKYKWKHTNHDPTNLQEVVNSRLPPTIRLWIEKKVIEGLNWKEIKALLHDDSIRLEIDANTDSTSFSPASLVTYQNVRNVISSKTGKDSRKNLDDTTSA